MATSRTSSYTKNNFTEDGKFETTVTREGRSRGDAYYTRTKTLLKKALELHTSTGAHVKVIVIPTWHNGKSKAFESTNFPELVAVDDHLQETEAGPGQEQQADALLAITASPVKEPLPLAEVNQNTVTHAAKKDKCGICSIVYGSDADFLSHWVQCSHKNCSWWVHCRCLCIYYPTTEAGLKALNKWAKDRIFLPKTYC
ncbi:NFXL1 [Mytilus coruscus]|uniref:NFXL1 n=1 Tax=Mytilus coruscus TaxID=42192 RepID=A0A6J8A1V9_MYTCO|nr:NFXL1 [Mytilus coruscus]